MTYQFDRFKLFKETSGSHHRGEHHKGEEGAKKLVHDENTKLTKYGDTLEKLSSMPTTDDKKQVNGDNLALLREVTKGINHVVRPKAAHEIHAKKPEETKKSYSGGDQDAIHSSYSHS